MNELMLARDRPGVWSRAVLLAPTWRGPLPTAMGEHPGAYGYLRALIGIPIIGQTLYRLNTARSVIGQAAACPAATTAASVGTQTAVKSARKSRKSCGP
jgi:hypothetical protein